MSHLDVESKIDEILGITKKSHHHITKPKPNYNELVKWFEVRPMAIPASNLLSDANNFAPEKGFIWDITRVGAQGFTVGSVSIFRRSQADVQLGSFTSAGNIYYQDHNLIINSRTNLLVFTGTNLTGTAFVSCEGFSVHESVWAKYIMGG